MFTNKIETPQQWHKMPQEYKDLFTKVMTIHVRILSTFCQTEEGRAQVQKSIDRIYPRA
jgi:hypothetical protein